MTNPIFEPTDSKVFEPSNSDVFKPTGFFDGDKKEEEKAEEPDAEEIVNEA